MPWISNFYSSLSPDEVFLFWCSIWGGIITIATISSLLAPTIKHLEFIDDDEDDDDDFPWGTF